MRKPAEPKASYMTVDTGINIGYAIFHPESQLPRRTGLLSVPSLGNWSIRAMAILNAWTDTLQSLSPRPKMIYLEEPQFLDSSKGITAATSKNLFKLIYMYACTHYIAKINQFPVTNLPIQWKGQMGKKMVDERISRILGETYPEHISDAVGMGLFLKGKL